MKHLLAEKQYSKDLSRAPQIGSIGLYCYQRRDLGYRAKIVTKTRATVSLWNISLCCLKVLASFFLLEIKLWAKRLKRRKENTSFCFAIEGNK